MGKRSPVLGYNHNFKHRGLIFHVQTEDSGVDNPHLFTHLFHGGVIISSRKIDYDAESEEDIVKALMQSQHKAVLKDLKIGTFDNKIDSYLGNKPDLEPRKPDSAAGPAPQPGAVAAEAARAAAGARSTAAAAKETAAAEAAQAAAAQAVVEAAAETANREAEEAAAAEIAAQEAIRVAAAEAAHAAEAAAALKAVKLAAAQQAREAAAAEAAAETAAIAQVVAAQQAREAADAAAARHAAAVAPAATNAISLDSPVPRPIEDRAATIPVPVPPALAPAKRPRTQTRERIPTPIATPIVSTDELGDPMVTFTAHSTPPPPPLERTNYSMRREKAARRGLTPEPARAPTSRRPGGKAANPEPGRPRSSVVVSRPSVIIGAPPQAVGKERPRRAPSARKARGGNLFGKDLISEKSLDEVIMAYLSEDSSEE